MPYSTPQVSTVAHWELAAQKSGYRCFEVVVWYSHGWRLGNRDWLRENLPDPAALFALIG